MDKASAATRALIEAVGRVFPLGVPLELWDGTAILLGPDLRHPTLRLHIRDAGAIPTLLRRPKLDTILMLHAAGALDISGGTLLDLGPLRPRVKARDVVRTLGIGGMARLALPLLTAPGVKPGTRFDANGRPLAGASSGDGSASADVQFHYDLSNAFYQLFLDERMVYTCAYFTEWHDDLGRAQFDKIDMICRKLRLKPGDHMLDIGCGWGALLIHAATHYGVTGDGVTLAAEQVTLARERVKAAGLEDRITIHLKPYEQMPGPYDKIASIGMFEHIGIAGADAYFAKVHQLLKPGGLYLHHAITRRGRKSLAKFRRKKPEYEAMRRYIFPGGEVDHIGFTCTGLEDAGFEVHDVEGWRAHYAATTALWARRLAARRAEAEALVGPERTRIWLAYLAGVSLAFSRGSLSLFQTLASKKLREGHDLANVVPPSRADLYR